MTETVPAESQAVQLLNCPEAYLIKPSPTKHEKSPHEKKPYTVFTKTMYCNRRTLPQSLNSKFFDASMLKRQRKIQKLAPTERNTIVVKMGI
ncbi:MAG: hypothetical protein AAF385_06415 [Pseudomonadota bacterium]